jgi:FkbM family methyltransferase
MENEEIKNEERFVKKQINPDQDFYGFTMRTRRHFRDESILRDELERDIYQIPENPKVVIDIGAHIGGTALRCAKAGATVYAFEPEYSNFKTLVYNVIKNNLRDKVFPINMGIGERGHSKLYTHLNNSGAVSTQTVQSGLDSDRYQVIALMPLEDVFEQYKIEKCNLLKMDCEGGEEYVIRNLAAIDDIQIYSSLLKTTNTLVSEALSLSGNLIQQPIIETTQPIAVAFGYDGTIQSLPSLTAIYGITNLATSTLGEIYSTRLVTTTTPITGITFSGNVN